MASIEEDYLLKQKIKKEEDLFLFIKNRIDKISNYNLLLGAGASVTSNINTGLNLVREWKREIFSGFAENNGKEYSDAAAEAFFMQRYGREYDRDKEYSFLFKIKYHLPSQRRNFIETEIQKAIPSIGYNYLANLVGAKYFNTIFTTNFDDLIEQALLNADLELKPIVCSHDASITSIPVVSNRPKVIKLHGDFLFDDIKTTIAETSRLEKNMGDKFEEFLKNFGLIVMGYSGRDDSIMEILERLIKKEGYLDSGLYWCVRDFEEIEKNYRLKKLLLNDKVYVVKIGGFDEFLAKLNASIDDASYDKRPYKIKTERITYSEEVKRVKDLFKDNTIIQGDCVAWEKNFSNTIKDLSSYVGNPLASKDSSAKESLFDISKLTESDEIRAGIENINALLREDKLDDVLALIDKMEGKESTFNDPLLFNLLIDIKVQILRKNKDKDRAIATLNSLKEINKRRGLLEDDVYIDLVDLYMDNEQLDKALTVLDEAKNEGVSNSKIYLKSAQCKEKLQMHSLNYCDDKDIIDDYERSIVLNPYVKTNSAFLELAHYLFKSPRTFNQFGEDRYNELILKPFQNQNPFDPDFPEVLIDKLLFDIECAETDALKEQRFADITGIYQDGRNSKRVRYRAAIFGNYLKACRKRAKRAEFEETCLQIDPHLKKTRWFVKETSSFEISVKKSLADAIAILEKNLDMDSKNELLFRLATYQMYNNNLDFVNENLSKFDEQLRDDLQAECYIVRKDYDKLLPFAQACFEKSRKTISDYMQYSYRLLVCSKYPECVELLNSVNSQSDILTINYDLARLRSGRALRRERIDDIYKKAKGETKAAACVLMGKLDEAHQVLKERIAEDYEVYYRIRNYPVFEQIDFDSIR